jgi:hypothetical protein
MQMPHFRKTFRLVQLVSTALLLLLVSTSYASGRRDLWQSREQFVALESQDAGSTGTVQSNEHPAELSQERLLSILASISVRETAGSPSEPLFTYQALQALAPNLRQALKQAAPGEDVTFAIIGLHDALYGLAKSPRVSTGRVFYKGGQLNIIFGLVRQEVRDRDDRRLYPFTPGSRSAAAAGEWKLLIPGEKGVEQIRRDWLTFANDWTAPPEPQNIIEQKAKPAVAPVAVKPVIDTRKPAERLTILNELKSNGLISEEEYKSKRLEILNGL